MAPSNSSSGSSWSFASWFSQEIGSYPSVALINIRNPTLGLLHKIIQLTIIAYVAYSLIEKQSYQLTSDVDGISDIKVKGAAYTNESGSVVVYDSIDNVVPVSEPNAFFITTNQWVTHNQTKSTCADWADGEPCESDADCAPNAILASGIGTGRCVNGTLPVCPRAVNASDDVVAVSNGSSVRVCEVSAWCPLEYEVPDCPDLLIDIRHATVFVRISVRFTQFDIAVDNIGGNLTRGVNLFTIDDIVSGAGYTYEDVALRGASIIMNSEWACDLDRSLSYCQPKFTFTRTDNPLSAFSSGYNFRSANYYGDQSRDLYKRYGIRVFVVVSGRGGMFGIVPTMTAIGAGLGLLGIASVVADLIAFRLCGQRSLYYSKFKFTDVNDTAVDDDERLLTTDSSFASNHQHAAIVNDNERKTNGSFRNNQTIV